MGQEVVGVRRSLNAEEGAKRFFQTTDLIISHFKREADKKSVYQLTGNTNTLTNLLVGSSAVHLYHQIGIRTKSSEEEVSDVSNAEAFEIPQKKDLYNEIVSLLNQSLPYEIDLSQVAFNYEIQILDAMIAKQDISGEEFTRNLKDLMEEHLVNALNKYPSVFFFDHVGELTGYINYVKQDILKETAGFKTTSIDLEKDMVKQEHEDKYIELSTFNRLIKKMEQDFEFKSINLKLETFPIHKMLTKILAYRLNLYPTSIRALETYKRATIMKQNLYNKFLEANQKSIDYNTFESDILSQIIKVVKNESAQSPQTFVYWLENLLELGFEDVYDILNRYGIGDVPNFCQVQQMDFESFKKDVKLFNLSKMDLVQLNKADNEIALIEAKLNDMKLKNLVVTQRSVREILTVQKVHEINYLKDCCTALQLSYEHLVDLYQKEKLLKEQMLPKYSIKWYSTLLMLYDLPEIYQNLARFIYFNIFSKISRQVARITETYIQIKEDKNLYLLGLKRIMDTQEQEDWVRIKIEELIIQRVFNRQEELATIFNAENQAFLVNAFIFAHLTDSTLEICKQQLLNEISPIYEEVAEISLPHDMISPVSYIFALDLIERIKDLQETKLIKKEQSQEIKTEKAERKIEELHKIQQSNTLNWIEKKITATLMSIRSTNSNPTGLYWSDKDQKVTMDTLKLHSELKDRKLCDQCGLDTTTTICPDHGDQTIRDATPLDLFTQYYMFALSRIQELWPKLKIPNYMESLSEIKGYLNEVMGKRLRKTEITLEDSIKIIEGERLEVAKRIAKSIGENLDKALYKVFKEIKK